MSQGRTAPLRLQDVQVTDALWKREMELVRREVIPYQWEALNDRIDGAAPSFWMHNMKAASRAIAQKKHGKYVPRQRLDGMVVEPKDGETPLDDGFYGWAFQDSDGYKWLEAVAYQLAMRPDEKLRSQAQVAIDAIVAAQEEDGYIDTFYTILGREKAFTNLKDHHELYCFGHLTEAAVAWKQATGREDLLNVARRFGECIARRFGPEGERGCPGHEIAEMALIRLYDETGEEKWLDMARFFLDVRGTEPNPFALEDERRGRARNRDNYRYYQADRPVRDMDEAVGHAVRQMYLASGMTDEARLTGDRAMWQACLRLWKSVVKEKLYVTGGVGGTHVGEAFSRPYDLPSDTAYSETCAAIGLAFWARRMLEAEIRGEYADVMEMALYNTVLAGMAMDGRSFFYVNPLECDPAACRTDERLSHVKSVRQKWFGCACCPPNIARIVSSLPAYIATANENEIYVHLYAGCRMKARLGQGQVEMEICADLTRSGHVTARIVKGQGEGVIAFREPGWTKGASFVCPGKRAFEKDGYWRFEGAWREGDEVVIDLPMPVRVLAANPMVWETAGQVALARGPFTYCAEEADNGKGLHLLRVDPRTAPEAEGKTVVIGGAELPALTVKGERLRGDDRPLYAEWKEETGDTVDITLVPYFAWNNRGEGEMRVWLNTK